jgi:hypothetical protein
MVEPVRQDSSFAEKQESRPARLLVVPSRRLGAAMRTFAADDQARPLRPGVEREVVGQLGHPRTVARLVVAVDRRPPRGFGQGQDRIAHARVDRVAEGEPDGGFAARVGQRVAGAGRVRAREDRPIQRLRGGSCSSANSNRSRWSAALLAPALPGRRIMASTSCPQLTSSRLNPSPPL